MKDYIKKVFLSIVSLIIVLVNSASYSNNTQNNQNKEAAIEEGEYEIYSGLSETKVLNISGAKIQNEAKLEIYERQNLNNQKFKLKYNQDGTYTFIAKHSNKVLDVQYGCKEPGTIIWQYESNNTDAQKWYIIPCGNGYYNIVSKLNGLYLDVLWGDNKNGQPLQTYHANGTKAQKFYFEKVLTNQNYKKELDNGIYRIYSKVSDNRLLSIENYDTNNKSAIKLAESNNLANQIFKLNYNNDGTYSITVQQSGKAIDLRNAEGKICTKVQQYSVNNTNAQKWIIIKNDDNTYSVISKCNGLVWDVEGANSATGTTLQTYRFNKTKAQKFTFEKVENYKGKNVANNGTYRILSRKNLNMAFDMEGGSTQNGTKLQIWESSKVSQQKYELEYDGNGAYKIKSKKSGKLLTVESEKPKEGSEITQQEDINSNTQKWLLKKYSESEYAIISKCGNLYMELTGDSIYNGMKLNLKEQNDLKQQRFIFIQEDPVNTADGIKDGIYKIELKNGKKLDVSEGSYKEFGNIQIWNDDKVQQQKFRITKINGSSYYEITAIHSALLLDVCGGNDKPGTNIDQYFDNSTDSQKWLFKKTDDNYYNIISKNGLVMDVEGGHIDDCGANIQLYYSNDTDAQKFKLIPVNIIDNDTYEIETKINSNKVIDVSGGKKDNYQNVQIWNADNVNQQRFIFEAITNDIYKIVAKHSNKALTVDPNNGNVYQQDYNGNDTQKWKIKEVGYGYYNMVSVFNDLALDIDSGISQNGQNVRIYSQNGTDAQKFKFVEGFRKFYEEGSYGKSGLYYTGDNRASELKYYKIGKGDKVLFATFSIHGFEDSYNHDGAELTYIAEEFKKYLVNNIEESIVNNWTIYIFPCLNPDGQTYGYTNDGPGRTTLYSLASKHKGIDMNRNWSVGFTKDKSDRYYNGEEPFQAYEARCLREFILSHQGSKNILIDTHGWLNETLGDYDLGGYYRNSFGLPKHIGSYGQGYLINWVRTLNNGRSVLLELPEVKSHNQVVSGNYVTKYINATMQMLREN